MGGNSVISFDGISFKEHTMETDTYGFGCGGFPIRLKGEPLTEENSVSSIIGCVALSGLPDPQDHDLVVRALERAVLKK